MQEMGREMKTSTDREWKTHFSVSGTDPFVQGHYPGNPVFPGVMIANSLAWLAERAATGVAGEGCSLVGIRRIQYLHSIRPGDRVDMSVHVQNISDQGIQLQGTVLVRQQVAVRATLLCKPGTLTPPLQDGSHGREMRPERAPVLEYRDLMSVLPHRYPFLLLDQVEHMEAGHFLRARCVTGHTLQQRGDPSPTEYPFGFVIESIGQAGIALFLLSQQRATDASPPRDVLLGSLGDVRLFCRVPRDVTMQISVQLIKIMDTSVVFRGKASIGGEVVCEVGSLIAMLAPQD